MAVFKNSVNNFKRQLLSPNNNAIIHNTFVLYFILILSLLDLFYLSVENDMTTIVVFILVGILTSFFSKNMLIILFIALTVSNVVKYGTSIRQEGFEDEHHEEEKESMDELHPSELNESGVSIPSDKKDHKKKSEDKETEQKDKHRPQIFQKLKNIMDAVQS